MYSHVCETLGIILTVQLYFYLSAIYVYSTSAAITVYFCCQSKKYFVSLLTQIFLTLDLLRFYCNFLYFERWRILMRKTNSD